MIKIAICDDDLKFLNIFEQTITNAFTDAGQSVIVFKYSDGKSLIEKIEKEKHLYDIIFLDVDMPAINGFQVAQRIRELKISFILIFTTYLEHRSREGYLYGAFRYVFKNNLENEIREAVSGIVKRLHNSTVDSEIIVFKCRISNVLEDLSIQKSDILLLKKEKTRRVILKTIYMEYELLTKPLSEYAKLLEPPNFIRVLRNYIVNFNHVEGIDNESFILAGGVTVPLGIKREAKITSKEKYLNFLKERI